MKKKYKIGDKFRYLGDRWFENGEIIEIERLSSKDDNHHKYISVKNPVWDYWVEMEDLEPLETFSNSSILLNSKFVNYVRN
jgi:hypothetical protein